MRPIARVGCFLLTALWLAAKADAYVLEGQRWPSDQPIVMNLQLGAPAVPLRDGSMTWNEVATAAMDVWNPYLRASRIELQPDESPLPPRRLDGVNSVFFSPTIFGEDFGSDTLAITVAWYNPSTNLKTEADMVFNTAKQFDSYRGGQLSLNGKALYDLRRIAIHEFGHVLGLEHTAQDAKSIMAPRVTSIDTVQPDDIAGVMAIYEGSDTVPIILSDLESTASGGKDFAYQIDATGAANRFGASGLPAGLGVDPATGLISGTPTKEGTYRVGLSATNGRGTGTATLVLDVYLPPLLTSSLDVTAVAGQPFQYQITTNHRAIAFTFQEADDRTDWPAGLSFDNATGLLSGVPLKVQTGNFRVYAFNPAGQTSGIVHLTIVFDQAVTVLHRFNYSDGAYPAGPLVLGTDGNLYGGTGGGATSSQNGLIFKISPAGDFSVVFMPTPYDGGRYAAPLIQTRDGNFYGVASMHDTIFRVTPDGQRKELAHVDYVSSSALVEGDDGGLYGSTYNDETLSNFYGSRIFKVTPDGELSTFYAFPAGQGGVYNLMRGADGNFYGAARQGGVDKTGTMFRLTPAGEMTTICQFAPASFIQGRDGSFYGSTSNTLFNLAPDGAVTTLHTFTYVDGYEPSRLVEGSDGNLYGTTSGYGSLGDNHAQGTLFRMSPDGVAFATLHYFVDESGIGPNGGLIEGPDGEFYGVTSQGGSNELETYGTIYKTRLREIASMPQIPVVTLSVDTPTVTLGGGAAGVFTVKLSAPQSEDVVVHYKVTGNAANGTDYRFLSGTKRIKAGRTSRTIKIIPQGDLGGRASKTVKLSLEMGDGYVSTTLPPAKMKIVR